MMLLMLPIAAQAYDLRVHLPVGPPIVFNAMENRSEGSSRTSLGTRFELNSSGAMSVNVSTGPYTSQGRTFGRKKSHVVTLTAQGTVATDRLKRPPFMLSVPLPSHPVKVGDYWSGVIVGPTPLPAEVTATFKVLSPVTIAKVPCVRIGTTFNWEREGIKVTGGGEISVRLADGLAQNGAVNVLVVFRRPDPVTRKMTVSATTNVKATIVRS